MGVAERREREKQERKRAIVDAARRVFNDKGVAAATMDDVATAAEVSKGTLYLYFSSKTELFGELVRQFATRAVEHLDDISVDAQDGLQEVETLLRGMQGFAIGNRDQFLLGTAWLMPGHPDVETEELDGYREAIHTMLGRFVSAVARGQQDGSIRNDHSPLQLAILSWSALRGVLMVDMNSDRIAKRNPAAFEALPVAPNFIRVCLDGLANREGEG